MGIAIKLSLNLVEALADHFNAAIYGHIVISLPYLNYVLPTMTLLHKLHVSRRSSASGNLMWNACQE